MQSRTLTPHARGPPACGPLEHTDHHKGKPTKGPPLRTRLSEGRTDGRTSSTNQALQSENRDPEAQRASPRGPFLKHTSPDPVRGPGRQRTAPRSARKGRTWLPARRRPAGREARPPAADEPAALTCSSATATGAAEQLRQFSPNTIRQAPEKEQSPPPGQKKRARVQRAPTSPSPCHLFLQQ